MSSRKKQGPRGSSRHRSASARLDQRISATESDFQALSLSSQTPSPSIPLQAPPKGPPADFSTFGSDSSGVAGGEDDWESLTMTAAVDPRTAQLPFSAQLPYRNPETVYSHYSSRSEPFPAQNLSAFDCTMPVGSADFGQQGYYPDPLYSHLSGYGQDLATQCFPESLQVPIPQQPGIVPSNDPVNVPGAEPHHYGKQQVYPPVRRPVPQRTSTVPTEQRPAAGLSRPGSRPEEFLYPGLSSGSAQGPYGIAPSEMSSLPSSYMGLAASTPSSQSYSPSSSLYEVPSQPYSTSRPYSYSSTSGGNLRPASSDAPPSSYGISAGGDDQVRVVNARPKPQCWDHGCNGREFSTFSNLLRHQRERAGTAAKSECPHCGTVFTRTTARNGHLAQGKCKAKREARE